MLNSKWGVTYYIRTRPQMGPMLAPWILLSGLWFNQISNRLNYFKNYTNDAIYGNVAPPVCTHLARLGRQYISAIIRDINFEPGPITVEFMGRAQVIRSLKTSWRLSEAKLWTNTMWLTQLYYHRHNYLVIAYTACDCKSDIYIYIYILYIYSV